MSVIVSHCLNLIISIMLTYIYNHSYNYLFLAENRTPWSVGFREMYHRTWWWIRECLSYRYILFYAFLIGMVYTVLEMNIWIYWSDSNSWNLFYILYIWIKTEKFTVANKVLLVLECRTGAHREDCVYYFIFNTSTDSSVIRSDVYQSCNHIFVWFMFIIDNLVTVR